MRIGIASSMGSELSTGLRCQLRRLLASTPATELISHTARTQWRLIVGSALTAVVAAFSEGLTLAIIFLVVDVLTGADGVSAVPWPWLSPGLSLCRLQFLLCC